MTAMTVDPAIAELIREVLAEELARLRPGVREERVRVANDADLAAFARRVLSMADDPGAREAFETGAFAFRLDGARGIAGGDSGRGGSAGADGGRVRGGRESADPAAPSSGRAAARNAATDTEVIEGGLMSERHVDRLPPGTARLRIGRRVRMTPLARDRLRRRGIAIERIE